jgi:hypothetical protein
MLLLFLLVLFVTAIIALINQTFEASVDQRLGASIFQIFTGILTGASLLFIPLYVGIRLAAERQESNMDLLYITTLTPHRIIRGKFLCGAYMIVLFFSACMPFMAFTNLLRGVDLPTVAFILAYLFAVVCVAIQVAIFIACLPISRLLKILLALGGLALMIPTIAGLTYNFYELMRSGVGSMMGSVTYWQAYLTAGGCILAAVVLLYLLSVALISPISANRALPLRGYLTAIWVLGGFACAAFANHHSDARIMLAWCIATLIVLAFSVIVVISNLDQLSHRVRRQIPANPFRRALAFLFFNGAAGGLVWVSLIAAITFAVTTGALHWTPGWKPSMASLAPAELDEFETMVGPAVLYALAYALTALFIQRQFLPRKSPKLAGIFAILLPGIWALAPNIFLFFANRLNFRSLESNQLGNVFNVFIVKDREFRIAHLVCAGAWVVLMILLNARWFSRQLKQFQPLGKFVPTEPARTSAPPPIPTQTGAMQS